MPCHLRESCVFVKAHALLTKKERADLSVPDLAQVVSRNSKRKRDKRAVKQFDERAKRACTPKSKLLPLDPKVFALLTKLNGSYAGAKVTHCQNADCDCQQRGALPSDKHTEKQSAYKQVEQDQVPAVEERDVSTSQISATFQQQPAASLTTTTVCPGYFRCKVCFAGKGK